MLVFAGGGDLGSEMCELARSLGIDERTHFLGVRSDVAQILHASDIFVHPSIDDPCPLAVLEATASGLPVVAYRTGGIPEIVNEGHTALLADVGDIDELRRHLRVLIHDPAMRLTFGSRARARTEEKFRPADAGARFAVTLAQFGRTND